MRLVVLPQAVRRVLPPLMNDFIALTKDVALVSVLAVGDVVDVARDAPVGHLQLVHPRRGRRSSTWSSRSR